MSLADERMTNWRNLPFRFFLLAWSHSGLTTMTNEEIVGELKWTEKYIFDHTGYKVKYFRPPYGKQEEATAKKTKVSVCAQPEKRKESLSSLGSHSLFQRGLWSPLLNNPRVWFFRHPFILFFRVLFVRS